MPLVADAPGVEAERKFLAQRLLWRRHLRRDEARLAVCGVEAATHEEAPVMALGVELLAGAQRPLHGIERVERGVADLGEAAEVEITPPLVLERGQLRVLAKHVGGRAIGKRRAETH